MKTVHTLFFLLFMLATLPVQADELVVRAYMDKTVVVQNQQFTLSVELSGKDAQSVPNPELPDLDGFAAFLGSGSSQSIQYVNGKMSVSKTIAYHYMATVAGDFTIGPVTVRHRGRELKTDPIPITVRQAAGPSQTPAPSASRDGQSRPSDSVQDMYVCAEVDKTSVYPNEAVILTYQIYTRVNLTPAGISKQPATTGFWAEDFELPKQLPTTTEVIRGQRYTVATFKKMALFPTGPGKKTIEPLGLDCDVRVQRQRSRDPFEDFFGDSFFLGRTERRTLHSQPIGIEVKPFPAEGRPADFSGTAGSFRITAVVDKHKAETHDAVMLRVTITGTGNIRTLTEPRIQIPPDFETYPPRVSESVDRTGTSISGSKSWEYVLVPRNPGLHKIQPIRFSYFDPRSEAYRTVQTEEIAVQVEKGRESFAGFPSGPSRTAVQYLGRDIRFIMTAVPRFTRQGTPTRPSVGFWIVALLPVAALGLAFVYRKHRSRLEADTAYARERQAGRAARKHLARARSLLREGGADRFYAEVSRALSSFVGNKLNISEAGMMTADVRKRLAAKQVAPEVIADYFDCLAVCDRMRFAPSGIEASQMRECLKKAEQAITDLDRQIRK